MTDTATLEARLREAERKLGLLEERFALNAEVDEQAEIAIRDRLPLDHAMRNFMPVLCRAVGAELAWIRTFDDTLALHDFVHGTGEHAEMPISKDRVEAATADGEPFHEVIPGATVVAQRIDVAGEAFGTAAVVVPRELDEAGIDRAHGLLDTFCEEIDNTLAAVALARTKANVVKEISDALKDPVLDTGLERAIEVLRKNVPFEDLMLVFRHEDDMSGQSLRYKILKQGKTVHDSTAVTDEDVDAFMRSRAFRMMSGDDDDVRQRFEIRRYREEVMITGVRSARVIGRVVITSQHGEFNTFDRDLLDRFADSLRQRIVDFNREWKGLSRTFPKETVEKLLAVEGYHEKYLRPRERECAVMFCDISGFTRLSEQVLVHPQAIGRLIDTWSERVVEILWETGGVFDKMVGDCVIGLWGPPLYPWEPAEACRRAAIAATRIRAYTRGLPHDGSLPELAGQEVDVATGLSWCPLFVGTFGPDEDFTGFSAGMNNTARLQGQAKGGEILCMSTFVEQLGDESLWGDWREARVKNVEHPLRFRPLVKAL